jgi:malate dehydrogenase (oxaloacetate-decarboxylating)(NADP+)
MSEDFRKKALDYHKYPNPGKLGIEATTSLATQNDLALAYSPGVAYACEEIAATPLTAGDYTARANLVGVVSNGTAVLGLGAIGALAGKPVMEGKAVLFKKFANIDVFDIEIDEQDPMLLAQTIERLEPTFGGINLEDIKAPDCFIVEEYLRERMSIPVFHDDQHGTAIVVAAALTSALDISRKSIEDVKLVASGAGAAALACLNLLVSMGLKRENIIVTDIDGVVYQGREVGMDEYKARYAVDTPHRTLADAIEGADVFLGLSAANVLKPEMVEKMAANAIIFALANPNPEISPPEARAVRDDLIIATGRSDYPNQVNNVLCFPFLFRGALDVGATEINDEMKIACVHAISSLAKAGTSDIVSSAYVGETLRYGPEYLIPKPFDPRLIVEIASAVAKAAMDSGVATRPIEDLVEYRHRLSSFVYQSSMVMKPIFDMTKDSRCRVVFAEGENLKVLQAAENLVRDGIAFPIFLGQPGNIKMAIKEYGLDLVEGRDYEVVYDVEEERYSAAYFDLMQRRGVSESEALSLVRSNTTLQAALMVKLGDADTMICGSIGRFHHHLEYVLNVSGQTAQDPHLATLNVHILPSGMLFIGDTQVKLDPSVEDIAQLALEGAREVARFGVEPRVALVSHSNFGNRDSESSRKMREALKLIRQRNPQLNVDGEMQADAALSARKRHKRMPNSTLQGDANLLIMPSIDAGNITSNALKTLGSGVSIGPLLMGCTLQANIARSSITVRGLVNLTTVTVAQFLHQDNK